VTIGHQLPESDAAEVLDRLGPATSAERRAVSRAGWLFDAREFEQASQPSPAGLDAIVAGLTAGASTCADLGLIYLPAMIPAKRNLISGAAVSDRSWVVELNARLRDVDEVELMNLLPVLRHARRHGAPYHRTDADWNDRGAFFVARALLKEAHKRVPALEPPPVDDLHLRPISDYRGTLAETPTEAWPGGGPAPRESDLTDEDGVVVDASRLHGLRMPVESDLAAAGPAHVRVYANPEPACEARVAVVGDAAAEPVVVWLAERVRRTTLFESEALPLAQLELEAPQVVFHLIRETDLPAAAWQ
jgi:SGNH hydrolase-like domain, acetyltransferase AlgX